MAPVALPSRCLTRVLLLLCVSLCRSSKPLKIQGYSTFAKYYSIGMMPLIALATLCFVLESEATVKGGTLYETSALAVFQNIELVSVIIFTIEYVLRLVCCPLQNWGMIRFILNVQNLIDLLACLPFWITMIIVAMNPGTTTGGFGFLRVVDPSASFAYSSLVNTVMDWP